MGTSKKISIIGAGPVGCYTAQLLKIYGYRPLLIEEHDEVGRPLHCTGLVGHKVFDDKRPFALSSSSITNVINGAVFHHDRQSFIIERKKVAYVIDRERFDKELSRGLDIIFEHRFLGIAKKGSSYIIETNKDEVLSDIVIGADGANSVTRRLLNPNAKNINYYKGVQLRIQTKPRYKDFVEVYLKQPSFFWIVPEAEDIVRIGTISENPRSDLQSFLKETGIDGKILDRFGGIVTIGICPNTVKDNVALVGDAACQLKPISYGGIYFGLRAASILAACIKEDTLKDYDSVWKKELAFEIKIGLKTREIYRRLDKEDLKEAFLLLKKQKALIEKAGDFENHGHLILEIIKRLSRYSNIGKLFSILFRNII